jgi:DNA-binding FadR family transcriptional regulator
MHFKKHNSAVKLSERVRERLEEVILAGEVKVNEQLPTEADLGASFGVSRTVIREALQRLEAQGLVESRIGSGSYVTPYPMDQVKSAMARFAALNTQPETFLNLLDLRMVIETETTGRLAERHDATAIADLHAIVKRMRRHKRELEAFARDDMDFHLRIAQAAGNPFFATILEPLKKIGQAFGVATYESAEVIDRTCREHRAILQAVADGDADAARTRIREHIGFARSHYLELLSRVDHETSTAES